MTDTKVVAIVSEKGGSGKTIVTVNLAVAAETYGLATTVFDLDPRANSTVWGDFRGEGTVPEVTPAQGPRLGRLIDQARNNQAQLVLIDTPGNAPELGDEAAKLSDAVIVPCRPFGPDLISIGTSVKRLQKVGKPTFVLINAAPPQGVETAEAVAAISAKGVEVCPIVLFQRKPYAARFHEGLTALEIEPKGKAAIEIKALLLWLCEKVSMLPSEQVIELGKQLVVAAA
jgi:chromosome partitioning protein